MMMIGIHIGSDAKPHAEADDTYITVSFEGDEVYENQYGIIYFNLHTTDPAFRFGSRAVLPKLNKGDFSYIKKLQTAPGNWSKETVNGREYKVMTLESYAFAIPKKGKYEMSGGKYRIIRQESEYYDDPIWGRRRVLKDVAYEIPIDKCTVKVSGLPAADPSIGFSGAIGEYKIETHIMSDEVVMNEPCHIKIRVSGPGMIEEGVMPDYSKAFKDNVKLRSISDDIQYIYRDDQIWTRLDLDCEIVPTARHATIGEVSLGYFDPVRKTYRKACSKPLDLDVESSLIHMETTDI